MCIKTWMEAAWLQPAVSTDGHLLLRPYDQAVPHSATSVGRGYWFRCLSVHAWSHLSKHGKATIIENRTATPDIHNGWRTTETFWSLPIWHKKYTLTMCIRWSTYITKKKNVVPHFRWQFYENAVWLCNRGDKLFFWPHSNSQKKNRPDLQQGVMNYIQLKSAKEILLLIYFARNILTLWRRNFL